MDSPWTDYVMGAISLFPLSGALPLLKGFFPTRLRAQFVTFSTIFSLLIYFWVQWLFEQLESLPFFIPWWLSALCALTFLIIYIVIFQSLKGKYRTFSGMKKALYIAITMIFYISFVSSLTYSFNVLENLKDYHVIKGIIKYDNKRIEQRATIVLSKDEKPFKTSYSKNNGNFFFIIKKDKYDECDTVIFKGPNNLGSTNFIKDMPVNQEWIIELRPGMI
ncbi:hypothetical protein ACFLRT_02355 [Acidobacteriota bacterium]